MSNLHEDINQLYKECRYLSGGYSSRPTFATVVAHGEEALPRLFSDLEQTDTNEHINAWVIFSLLVAIAGKDRPKLPNLGDSGRYTHVRNMWLAWGREKGLVSTEGAPEVQE